MNINSITVYNPNSFKGKNFRIIFFSFRLNLNILFIIINPECNLFIIVDNNKNAVFINCIYPPILENISAIFV